MKYWEIIADHLGKAGWTWGCVLAVDSDGRQVFVADAHRNESQRFIVRADEKLTAFVEFESAILRFTSRRAAEQVISHENSVNVIEVS